MTRKATNDKWANFVSGDKKKTNSISTKYKKKNPLNIICKKNGFFE